MVLCRPRYAGQGRWATGPSQCLPRSQYMPGLWNAVSRLGSQGDPRVLRVGSRRPVYAEATATSSRLLVQGMAYVMKLRPSAPGTAGDGQRTRKRPRESARRPIDVNPPAGHLEFGGSPFCSWGRACRWWGTSVAVHVVVDSDGAGETDSQHGIAQKARWAVVRVKFPVERLLGRCPRALRVRSGCGMQLGPGRTVRVEGSCRWEW